MRSSRVSRLAFVAVLALGAGAMQAPAASHCRVNGMPVSAVIADVADALSEATGGFRDGLAVANVSPLMPDDVIAVNDRLRKLSKPVGRIAEGVSALAKQRCFEQDAGGPGISPGYEFAIDLLACGGVKDVLMKSASRLRSPRGFDAPPVMAGVIDAVDGACEAYKGLIDRTVKWRFTRQPWKEVGIVEVDGQRCRREARPKIPRVFWCAVDVNRPDDPGSIAYSMCYEFRVTGCHPRDPRDGEGILTDTAPASPAPFPASAGQNVPDGARQPLPPPYGPATVAKPPPAAWDDLPRSWRDPSMAGPFRPDAFDAAGAAVDGVTAVVDQVGLINATGDLRAMGLDAEADLLQRAFAFLVLYGTTSTLFERLANDPTALERYNESLAARLGDGAPDCVDAGDGVPVTSAYYALPNSPPSDCFPVSGLPAAPTPVK